MASAEQLKALLRSHMDGDDSQFYSVAMQLAAHEAKLGHGKLADELRALIDKAKSERSPFNVRSVSPTSIAQPKGELSTLLTASFPRYLLSDLILTTELKAQLEKTIREQRQFAKIPRTRTGTAAEASTRRATGHRKDNDGCGIGGGTGPAVIQCSSRRAHVQVLGRER